MVPELIRVLIADDEDHARERLRDLLGRSGVFEIVAEARDGNEALQMIISHKPAVAFLDINMPGVPVFSSIPSLQNPPLVVFQTAYSEHAADAFDIDALDYMLKPVRFERLEKTVEKIRKALALPKADGKKQGPARPPARIAVSAAGQTRMIDAADITHIQLEDGICHIHTLKENIISDKFLNHFEDQLRYCRFFRTSRTGLVNLDHIAAIHRVVPEVFAIELKNGTQLDLSRRKAQELRKIIDF